MLTLATRRLPVQFQAGCTIHMPLSAPKRAVSINYAHKHVHQLGEDCGRVSSRVRDAASAQESQKAFDEEFARWR